MAIDQLSSGGCDKRSVVDFFLRLVEPKLLVLQVKGALHQILRAEDIAALSLVFGERLVGKLTNACPS